MWAKWTAFYNRAKSANAAVSLVERAYKIVFFMSGAAVIAWISRTWHWYWDTFSWAGVAFAFLTAWILLPLGFLLIGVAVHYWRSLNLWKATTSIAHQLPEITIPLPTPVSLQMALYVGNFSADFTKIKDQMYFAITTHIFNQTDRNITIESVRGNLIFEQGTMLAISPPENMPLIVISHRHDGTSFTIRQSVEVSGSAYMMA